MNQQEEMKKNLLEEIDGYLMNFVYVKDLMKVKEHMEKLKSKMDNKAPHFALITQCALIDSYMLCLMRLYDKSEKAKTIPNLIEKCKKNLQLFPSPHDVSIKIAEFEKKLSDDEYIAHAIQILRLRRDQYYAHNDKKYFGKRIENDESYLPNYCIWSLRDFTEELLSYFWSQLSNKKCRETKYDNDLNNLFI